MPETMNDVGETPSPVLAMFEDALGRLPDGYVGAWRNRDRQRFNLYRLAGPGAILKPCEMSSTKVIQFVLGFEPLSRGRVACPTVAKE